MGLLVVKAIRIALLGLLLFGATGFRLHGDPELRVSPGELQAAFILRLAHFVEWPPLPEEDPFVIILLGNSSTEAALRRQASGKSIGGHPIEVRRVDDVELVEDASLVFVGEDFRRWTDTITHLYEQRPVLTVGENQNFIRRGGVISLFFEEDHIRLAINQGASQRAGLSLDPQLLAVAAEVIP